MKNTQKKKIDVTIEIFNSLYIVGLFFLILKIANNLQWIFKLVRKWEIPKDPFFSKIN